MTAIASVSGRRILDVLAGMGLKTILLDEDIPLETALSVDVPVDVDLDDWPGVEAALRAVHERHPIEAVVSVRDSYVPLAGYLAARLGVRGMSLPAALICYDKARMRAALAGSGLPDARFAVAREPGEVPLLAAEVGFPLVLKPTHSAGGSRVRLCHEAAQLAAATAELTAEPGELLIEEYLEGPEYAVQTVTTNGRTELLCVLATHVGPPPRFAETGYDYPAGAPTEEIGDHVAAALAAIGFDNGIAHSQVRMTARGPRMVEINPRPPGGMLARVTQLVSGVDMVQAAVEVALGRPVTRTAPEGDHVLYRCVVFDRPGRLDYDPAALIESPAAVVEMDVDPGDSVLSVEHPDGGVYGRIVLSGSDRAALEKEYQQILARLDLRVEGGARP